ncbi:MAG: hypothetical protein ACTHMS_13175 [Jatrophihabitans sp.]|uniref:hypothetical protein n=1 Tax=Jatrophihabitans sp. TaxID=1932789 RepID=UPI003F81AB12
MAVTQHAYTNAILKAFNKEISWASDTIKVMLCTSAYTPDQNAHAYKSSVTNEVTGTGYTAGGVALASKTTSAASGVATLSAAAASWSSATITARYAVIYDSTGTDSTSPLIAWVDFGADVSSVADTFTVTWDPSGIISATAA